MPDDLRIDDRRTLPASCLRVETARSGGPGGQHVNTTETKVHLYCHLASTGLHPAILGRIRRARRGDINSDGELQVTCGSNRSRLQNLEEARSRLAAVVKAHLRPPKKRKKTKPTRGSKERRLKKKKRRGRIKSKRGKVTRKNWDR